MHVATEPIDPYIVYRLIHPNYYSWYRMKIVQRSTESFRERPITENQLLDNNCINCHSFSQNNPESFMLHVRGSMGGTYFFEDGELIRRDLRTDRMPANATYPSWHPSGKYVAFSANAVRQSFYAHSDNNIEVFDLESSLVLCDPENNRMSQPEDKQAVEHMQTFPSWSPDGRHLYYSRTRKPGKPFVLPQKDPSLYDRMLKSFNLPELVTGEVAIGPRDFERASEKEPLRALPVEDMVIPAE